MAAVYGRKCSRAEQAVLLAMADHANSDGGNCRPSVALVAWKIDYSERQVRRIIEALRERDVLRVEAPAAQHAPITYRINLDALPTKDERPGVTFQPARGDISADPGVTFRESRGDILSIGERPGVTFSTPRGDILSARGDIAMSPEPEEPLEPEEEEAVVVEAEPARPAEARSVVGVVEAPASDSPPAFEDQRDPLWVAVAAALGHGGGLGIVSSGTAELIGGLVRAFRAAGVEPADVNRARAVFPTRFPQRRPETVRPPTADQLRDEVSRVMADRRDTAGPPRDERIWFELSPGVWRRRIPSVALPEFGLDAYTPIADWPDELRAAWPERVATAERRAVEVAG